MLLNVTERTRWGGVCKEVEGSCYIVSGRKSSIEIADVRCGVAKVSCARDRQSEGKSSRGEGRCSEPNCSELKGWFLDLVVLLGGCSASWREGVVRLLFLWDCDFLVVFVCVARMK